jgi:hypothetical protein
MGSGVPYSVVSKNLDGELKMETLLKVSVYILGATGSSIVYKVVRLLMMVGEEMGLGPVGIEREQGPGRRRLSMRAREGGGEVEHTSERGNGEEGEYKGKCAVKVHPFFLW